MDTVDTVQVNIPLSHRADIYKTSAVIFIQFLSQLAVVYNFIGVTWWKKSKIYNVQYKKKLDSKIVSPSFSLIYYKPRNLSSFVNYFNIHLKTSPIGILN